MAESPGEITTLLRAWRQGDASAFERLTPLVYEDLRRLARAYIRRERAGLTLQATAVANEAIVRLLESNQVQWQDRAHFFALTARLMRRILVDAARARASLKRGGGERVDHSTAVNLDALPSRTAEMASQLCALDDALNALARMDPRRAQVIELRFFAGLTVEETGQVLKISPQSVMRDWKLARAWLARELNR
jgi:RNA polymerase sigma factor (TIGR02999 family)